MIPKAARIALLAMPLIVLPAALSGCQSTGPDKAQKTTTSMGTLSTEIETTNQQIGATLTAMNSMVASKEADLRPEYDAYVKALGRLESDNNTMKKRYTTMKSEGTAFFADWQATIAQMTNEEFKSRSGARLTETQTAYNAATESVGGTSKELDSLLAQFQDIQTFLGHDLNKSGVETISDLIESANADGKAMQAKLGDLSGSIEDLKAEMSSSTPQPPPAEGGGEAPPTSTGS